MPPRLILIRHGRTPSNAAQRFVSNEDPTLDEQGIEEAKRLARELSSEAVGSVYCSPMRRARETAECIVGVRPGERPLPVVDNRLMEVGFGSFEGKSSKEIQEEGDRELFLAWRQGVPPRYPPGAERFEDAARRSCAFFDEVVLSADATVVVVGHSHLLRIMVAVSILGSEAHHHRRLKLDSGRMAVVEWEEDVPRLVGLNVGCLHRGAGALWRAAGRARM